MTYLEAHRAAVILGNVFFFLMAAAIMAMLLFGGNPMTPELYGPTVYYFEAEMWTGAQMLFTSISIFGASLGSRFGSFFLAVGSVAQAVIYSFFGAAASFAAEGLVMTAASLTVSAPFAVTCFLVAVEDLKNARR